MAKKKATEEQITIAPEQQATPERSYFQSRIFDQLGRTPENNRIRLKFYELESNTTNEVEYPVYAEDD
ncbi:MAG: hypothetical protein Q8J97_02240, partial [Flavobacteriaceae bacterium]|nr:hypothetical protein [Flavobacteriaceae bacterium]